jgi:hypothetical protein
MGKTIDIKLEKIMNCIARNVFGREEPISEEFKEMYFSTLITDAASVSDALDEKERKKT